MDNEDTRKEQAAKKEGAGQPMEKEGPLSGQKKPHEQQSEGGLLKKISGMAGGKKEEQSGNGALSKKMGELSDQMLRLHAEFDNYKKRTAKEKEQLSQHAEARLMLRMLPIYEEIGLAEKEAAKIESEPVRKGVLMVLSKLQQSFEKEGLQEMKLEGEKFDPFRHDCAMKEDSDSPEGTIVRVIQKGYLLNGEVLRHAVVSVSSGKKEEKKE